MPSTTSEYRAKKDKMYAYLGGKCAVCGSTNRLHIDHKNPADKEFTVTVKWGYSWDRLTPELDKCQLLCFTCHYNKSKQEGSYGNAWTNKPRQKHGTVWSYSKYGCRCSECKAARSEASKREYQRMV